MDMTAELRTAVSWLSDKPEISEHARQSVNVTDKAFPDAIADDPSRLVEAAKVMAMEAIRLDAPEGVVEALMGPVRRMSEGLKNLHEVDYTVRKLAEMQGLRDRYELESALTAARDEAPDDTNRARLDAMLKVVPIAEEPVVFDERLSAIGGWDCPPCCVVGCLICGVIGSPGGPKVVIVGCVLCCIVGCLVCSI